MTVDIIDLNFNITNTFCYNIIKEKNPKVVIKHSYTCHDFITFAVENR